MFKRRAPRDTVEVEPFTGWKMRVPLPDDTVFDLSGYVYSTSGAETLRLVDAIADGLRRAGYEPEVTLTRKTEVSR